MRTRKRRFKGRIENGNQEESCKEGREEEKEVSEPKQRNGGGESLPQNFLRSTSARVNAHPICILSAALFEPINSVALPMILADCDRVEEHAFRRASLRINKNGGL